MEPIRVTKKKSLSVVAGSLNTDANPVQCLLTYSGPYSVGGSYGKCLGSFNE